MSVRVPAKPGFVHLVRSVAAGIAAKAALSIDEIEDIRLAVDEACAHLLGLVPASNRLTVEVITNGSKLELHASVDAPLPSGTEAGRSITWHILSALTDGATLEPTDTTTGIRMTKHVGS